MTITRSLEKDQYILKWVCSENIKEKKQVREQYSVLTTCD